MIASNNAIVYDMKFVFFLFKYIYKRLLVVFSFKSVTASVLLSSSTAKTICYIPSFFEVQFYFQNQTTLYNPTVQFYSIL